MLEHLHQLAGRLTIGLSPEKVTSATRMMLPVYVGVFLWIGFVFAHDPISKLRRTPALAYIDDVADLRGCGWGFIIAALLILVAIVTDQTVFTRFALLMAGAILTAFLAACIASSIWGDASRAAGALPTLAVAACAASYRSITRQENAASRHKVA